MAQGFYELLGAQPHASIDELRLAYQRRLAELVRRLRAARKQGADVSILENQEVELKEAMKVLSDRERRRRYDAYRAICLSGMPDSPEELWGRARSGLVDPVSALAVASLRELTSLPLGPTLPEERGLPGQSVVATEDGAPPVAPARRPQQGQPAPASEMEQRDIPPARGRSASAGLADQPLPIHARSKAAAPAASAEAAVVSETNSGIGDAVDRLIDRYGMDGRLLLALRESQGLSLEQVAERTRISQRYLDAIESNGYDSLPSSTFVRGYVKAMVECLGVADRGILEGYMTLFSHHRG